MFQQQDLKHCSVKFFFLRLDVIADKWRGTPTHEQVAFIKIKQYYVH